MFSQSKSIKPEVAISKGETPEESLINGVNKLGGLSTFINEGDQVFIKFNLTIPGGFPMITNLDVLKTLIASCKEVGAKKIYLGSFPLKGVPIKIISDLFNLKEYFHTLGADFVFLDNSDNYKIKKIDENQLKKIKYDSLTSVEINNNKFLIPNIILDSDKFISVNQINVNPLFKLNLSLLNLYSIVPKQPQEIGKNFSMNNTYLSLDQYKKDLISNILDISAIKHPNLIINDLFYVLEGAGPYIYKDSNLKRTRLMVIGNDPIAVDIITLNILNIDINSSELILQARKRNFNEFKVSDIKTFGEKVEDISNDIDLCVSNLQDIKTRNFSIYSGKYCSGCFKQAYHLLNLMKTYMTKDLKYNIKNSFLIGKKPTEPEKSENIILFGDCAINSTKDYNFRDIIIESKKDFIGEAKRKIKKESKLKKKPKIKKKTNKNILELPGCPPNIFDCLELVLDYFGKKSVPNLNLLTKLKKLWIDSELNRLLKIWEGL